MAWMPNPFALVFSTILLVFYFIVLELRISPVTVEEFEAGRGLDDEEK